MKTSLRVVFMGTPAFAVAGLRSIQESKHDVVAVVTAPDKPAGRGKKIRFSEVKKEAIAHNIPLLQPNTLNNTETIEQLQSFNADVFVVIAFRMLPKVIWTLPPLGTFNLHASLLPQYRGAAPIHWAVINGEKETGLTTFLIDDKIDTGAILLQDKMQIHAKETMGELSARMQESSGKIVIDTLDLLLEGTHEPKPQQQQEKLHLAPKLTKENTRIDWNRKGTEIVNLIHGLNPFPTAWSMLELPNEELYVKLKRAQFIEGASSNSTGTISIKDKQLFVAVADGTIILEELQLPNKKSMKTNALLNGFRFPENCRFV